MRITPSSDHRQAILKLTDAGHANIKNETIGVIVGFRAGSGAYERQWEVPSVNISACKLLLFSTY
ncbi:hypothetical protein CHH92_00400 [Bacillus sonorensis]|uniref:Uncharacterized protein n=1 Tax=Bacillus sonorensis L12 TaxID=1274524 RepID=M5PEU2_9BACI|nr:hypothetical protein [Bacillus sonorensis]EME75900.1 hypothetical protein BSONL12_02959 [Bacillus sonorensis L12]TWK72618.1 hypothetical protein CHCC20335_1283 [Bacillus paralicheniformis]MCY8604077.1 hypothetical protein [Bacillus sonorensis]PAD61967.1 hypothetical protein CHH92_00400 [Bacillus sonorensis]RHJ13797.1 hypothetical protein DW143_04180 [Bacillus sonorensis]